MKLYYLTQGTGNSTSNREASEPHFSDVTIVKIFDTTLPKVVVSTEQNQYRFRINR